MCEVEAASIGKTTELDLNLEYSPSKWVRRIAPDEVGKDYGKLTTQESNKFLRGSGFRAELNVTYGEADREKVDIFIPKEAEEDAPVFMFIHGGYWQEEDVSKNNSLLVAGPLINLGVCVAVVGYGLAPKFSVQEMVEQIQQATFMVANKFPKTKGIYISGHSAGGHLAAMMLFVDWESCMGGKNLIKGVCPVSGVFDLRPLVQTYINDPLSLTGSSAAEVSPMLMVNAIPACNLGIKVLVPYGEYDPPAFHRQSQAYCKLLVARGMIASCSMLKDRDHFDEITELSDENCALQQVFCELING